MRVVGDCLADVIMTDMSILLIMVYRPVEIALHVTRMQKIAETLYHEGHLSSVEAVSKEVII